MSNKFCKNLYLAILSFSFSFCISCVNDLPNNEVIEPGTIPIQLSTRIQSSYTRATDTSFEENDAIGLYVLTESSSLSQSRYIDNMKFTYNASQIFEPDETIFFPEGNGSCNFLSYYPYSANGITSGNTTMEVGIAIDQTTPVAFSKSNFMVANTANITATEETVDLLFRNKFSRLNIFLKPESGYTLESLLAANPVVRIKNLYTNAVYDFSTHQLTGHHTTSDISPYGTWDKGEEAIMGKSAIILPQTLEAEQVLLELIVDGSIYECKVKEQFTFKSGQAEDIILTLSGSAKGVQMSINPSLEGWGESNQSEMDANEVAITSIHIPDLNFAGSNIYKVIANGTQVAEICKEYLFNNDIAAQAVVIYPMRNGKADLDDGLVCRILNENGKKHGGKVSWDEDNNQLTYQEGDSEPIERLYIAKDKSIVTEPGEDHLPVQIVADKLIDKRGEETITYPLVKIATQYWMAGNLKATKYIDGTDINKGTDFREASAKYCQPNAYYYFYNAAAIAEKSLAPNGWRIGNVSDWDKLKAYIQEDASLLKNGASWGETSANNLTGFNGSAVGLYVETYKYQNELVYYWCTEDADPKVTSKTMALSTQNNFLNNAANNKLTLGASIRLIRINKATLSAK
ncbi:MAG: fimbrillin family protein [Bacteroides sp.]|nr:fimbrillin family protein [Bacteroides sp.]